MKKTLLIALISFLSFTGFSFENDLKSMCKRPGTSELFVGGEFNTIMVIDEKTGSTIRQFNIETKVIDMQFNPSGEKLITYDGEKVHFLNPEDGSEGYSFKATNARLFENSPFLLDADWIFSDMVKVFSTEDGSPVYTYQPSFDILDAGFDADFKELIIIGRSQEIKGEKKLVQTKVEEIEGYNVYNKAYVDQQDDGNGSGFIVIDMDTKAEKIKTELPYTPGGSFGLSISKFEEHYYIAAWDILIKVDGQGLATPIEVSNATFAYATNASADQQYVFIGAAKDGYVYDCKSGMTFAFDISEFGEMAYTADFTYSGDVVYMLAQDFSIAIMNNKAMVTRSISIEQSSEAGFEFVYYNGFSSKEDRDKEAAILNAALEELGMETIDLESDPGASDFRVGIFETMEAAKAFQQKVDDEGLQYITKIIPFNGEE